MMAARRSAVSLPRRSTSSCMFCSDIFKFSFFLFVVFYDWACCRSGLTPRRHDELAKGREWAANRVSLHRSANAASTAVPQRHRSPTKGASKFFWEAHFYFEAQIYFL